IVTKRTWLRSNPRREPSLTLGQVVANPRCAHSLEKAGQLPGDFLARHVNGDLGEGPPEDVEENKFSLKHGLRVLSAYRRISAGARLWAITEPDRSSTSNLDSQ